MSKLKMRIVKNKNTAASINLLMFNWNDPIFLAADEKNREVNDQRTAVNNALNSPSIFPFIDREKISRIIFS